MKNDMTTESYQWDKAAKAFRHWIGTKDMGIVDPDTALGRTLERAAEKGRPEAPRVEERFLLEKTRVIRRFVDGEDRGIVDPESKEGKNLERVFKRIEIREKMRAKAEQEAAELYGIPPWEAGGDEKELQQILRELGTDSPPSVRRRRRERQAGEGISGLRFMTLV